MSSTPHSSFIDTSASGAAQSGPDMRFRTLFEHAPFSVQLLAMDGRTTQVNKAWETLWCDEGNSALKDYVLGGEYNILQDPQLHAKGVTPYLQRAFGGESVAIPTICYDPVDLGKPGRVRWVRASAHPMRDGAGNVQEVMLVHEDVTERMETEQALRASEMRLKQLANSIPQLAWMADSQGWIHWYNDRWYEYTGASAADMQGWGWEKVHDPVVLPQVLERWKRSLATGEPFEMTFPLRGKDGKFRPFFTLVAPFKDADGKILQWFGTNTDVSALQAAENELRRAVERLQLATEAGDIGIWEWDLVRNEIIWSDRVHALHGLQSGAFDGSVAAYTALVHPDDRDMLWQKANAALAEKGGYSAEFRAALPDGSARWLATWAKVQTGADGAAERLIGATISIQEHKNAEAALLENSRRKDEFLAMLAHELRNPLAPISAAAEILKLTAADEQRVRQTSEIIERQAGHMAELIDDLMDVSRVTRGLIELDKVVLDLKSVATSAIEQVRPLLEARHHLLTVRMDAEHACVQGDRTRLVQIISNLLNNAAKYTPSGGEITLGVNVQDEQARIDVADNGSGIEPDLLPYVFDLFTQGKRRLDRSQGGLGLGLALVKSIVDLHGGQVQAHSGGAGMGSLFTISLPLAAPQAAQPLPPAAGVLQDGGARVMIVDDNLDAAHTLALLLAADGHQVTVQEDGASALLEADRNAPHVYILDVGLPGLDGYELVRRLRALPVARHAIFVALTGYGQAHDRALSKAAGFDHHFVKPVDLPQLARVLSQVGR